ncbi:MAG: hypothetical protein QXI50_07110, partial [Candidatus Caldarchaeum sp.]
MVFESVARIVKPFIVAVKHLFSTPVTVKYPYEKIVNTTGEYYRYDPKAGIAYPGFKGRHILYLDKCTGCSLCDIACQNIAEAIIMVYGFNVSIKFGKEFMEGFRSGDKTAVEFVENLTTALYSGWRGTSFNSHPVQDVAWTDFRAIQPSEDGYVWKLNVEPLFAYRSEYIVETYLQKFFDWLKS